MTRYLGLFIDSALALVLLYPFVLGLADAWHYAALGVPGSERVWDAARVVLAAVSGFGGAFFTLAAIVRVERMRAERLIDAMTVGGPR
jgi:hypothetical protein